MEFIEQPLTWNRLRAQGVTSAEEPAGELHLDLDESTTVVPFDLAARSPLLVRRRTAPLMLILGISPACNIRPCLLSSVPVRHLCGK